MRIANRISLCAIMLVLAVSLLATARSQDSVTVLTGPELTRIVPPGFYYQGLSAPTQMRHCPVKAIRWKKFDHHSKSALSESSGRRMNWD